MLLHLQEANQALELMGRWEMIDVCDALELLSPVFEREEVGLCKIRLLSSSVVHYHIRVTVISLFPVGDLG